MSLEDNINEQETKELHEFWDKQPVIKEDQEDILEGYIDPTIPVSSPPNEPAPLPPTFTWSNIDFSDEKQLNEVYKFLSLNYIEDSNHRFRFHLSPNILKWALTIPGFISDWIFGVRTKNGTLVGFISGIPHKIRNGNDIQSWCCVNFLCVHAKLRAKKMAPVLIFELARRVRLQKIYRAIFSGSQIPSKSFTSTPYSHRPINIKKLSSSGFYPVAPNKMNSCIKRFHIPSLVHCNLRPMIHEDIPFITELLNSTDSNFSFSIQFTPELVEHMFLPIENYVYSYVIPSPTGIKGFFSFYMMDWTILEENQFNITEHKSAYIHYIASNGIDQKSLIADLIYSAANDAKAEVINSLMISGLNESLIANKFELGNRSLEYYSYNYALSNIDPKEVRFIFI